MTPWTDRVARTNWAKAAVELDDHGAALTSELLTADEAGRLMASYHDDRAYRSTVDMSRYRFGQGQYRYYAHPLPEVVTGLRRALYPRLLPVAKAWADRLGRPAPWPDSLDDWLDQCHGAGQAKPTPLILRYGAGDWNALHRDIYGDLVFPLQVVINLTRPGEDYEGGEFLLVEQRPRAQSRGTSWSLPFGHGLIFTTRDRPVRSARGWSAAPVRHGVSVVRSGQRYAVGVLFHDAA